MEIISKVQLNIENLSRIVELGLEAQGYEVKPNSIHVAVEEKDSSYMMTPFGMMGGRVGYIKITATEAPRDAVNLEAIAGKVVMGLWPDHQANHELHTVRLEAEACGITEAVLRRVGTSLARQVEKKAKTYIEEPTGREVRSHYINSSGLRGSNSWIEVTFREAPQPKKTAKKKTAKKKKK